MSTEIEIIEAMGLELAGAAMRARDPQAAAAVLAAAQYRMAEVDDEDLEPTPSYYQSLAAGWLKAYDMARVHIVDEIADRMTIKWRDPERPTFTPFDESADASAYAEKVNALIAATEAGVIPTRYWAGIDNPTAPVVDVVTPQPGTRRHLPDPYSISIEVPEPFTEADDDPGCTLCGRDNRNGTHDALERTGHLRHAFTTTEPQS